MSQSPQSAWQAALQAAYQRADGLAGASNAPSAPADGTFVDGETPAGAIDGETRVFLLAYRPDPPLSLQLFRNGLAQRVDLDFSLSDGTISFLSWAIPQPGDILQAWYRRRV